MRATFGYRVGPICTSLAIAVFAAVTQAQAPQGDSPPQDSDSATLPTLYFHADDVGGDLFDQLHANRLLANLSKEALGSPIQLRIFHSVHPASVDAKNFFSGLLSIGTLGLSPVVMTGEHTLHYEIYVNGQRVARYDYSANLSRAQHLRSTGADATHGLGSDGQVWAKSTVDLFLKDLARDESVRSLAREYQQYFGTAAAAPASDR